MKNFVNNFFSIFIIIVVGAYTFTLIRELQNGLQLSEIMVFPLIAYLVLLTASFFSLKVLRNQIKTKESLDIILIFQILTSIFSVAYLYYTTISLTIKD